MTKDKDIQQEIRWLNNSMIRLFKPNSKGVSKAVVTFTPKKPMKVIHCKANLSIARKKDK